MKHILYIHQYFKTPKEPGGTRSYWIAKQLIEEGYRVTMLTTSSIISKNVENKKIDGINVVYLKILTHIGFVLNKNLQNHFHH